MEANPTVIRYAGDDFFIAITPSGHAQTVETRGERKAAAGPMELFIAGLGCCTATDVISILKKKRERVTDYHVEIRTTRHTEHPRTFERIELKHIVRGHQISEAAVARAIELSTSTYCGAINTVRPTAEVVTSYEIQEEPAS
jgi:putative redox protein